MNPDVSGLRPFQVPHVAKLCAALLRANIALDGSDTGVGKTWAALAVARAYGVVPLAIVPKVTVPSWEAAAKALNWEVEAVGYEKTRGRATKLQPASSEWGEAVKHGKGSYWRWRQPYEFVIFDEVDRCAGVATLNSKMLIAAKRQCKRVLCLSATAADNPLQMKALGFALGLHSLNDFWKWILKHGCKPAYFGGFEFAKDPDKQAAAMLKLHAAIYGAGKGARLRKSEIEGFPKTQIETKILPCDDSEIDALLRGIAEAAAGNKLEDALRGRQALELKMLPAMVDLAQGYATTSKVVLFCNYRETATQLRDALAKLGSVALVIGEQSEDERRSAVGGFQANRIDYLVSTYGAGGVGVSFHDPTGQVERSAFFMPCYSARAVIQGTGRVHRDEAAFSQQFLCYLDTPRHNRISLQVGTKLDNISALNDGELSGNF